MPINSYISGSVYSLVFAQSPYDSVIDCEASSISIYTGSVRDILVNTDKYSGSLPSGCIGVTTAQLKDAEYLSSIGFPIQT